MSGLCCSASLMTGARTKQRLDPAIDEAAISDEKQPRPPFGNRNKSDKARPLQRIGNFALLKRFDADKFSTDRNVRLRCHSGTERRREIAEYRFE